MPIAVGGATEGTPPTKNCAQPIATAGGRNQVMMDRCEPRRRGSKGSDGLDDLAGLDAARADVLAARGLALKDADLLQVRVEATLGRDHRVAA